MKKSDVLEFSGNYGQVMIWNLTSSQVSVGEKLKFTLDIDELPFGRHRSHLESKNKSFEIKITRVTIHR